MRPFDPNSFVRGSATVSENAEPVDNDMPTTGERARAGINKAFGGLEVNFDLKAMLGGIGAALDRHTAAMNRWTAFWEGQDVTSQAANIGRYADPINTIGPPIGPANTLLYELRRFIGKGDFGTARSILVRSNAASNTTTQIAPKNPNRVEIWIFNNGTATIYVGTTRVIDVTADANGGFPILASTGIILSTYTGELFAVSGTDNQDCRIFESSANNL